MTQNDHANTEVSRELAKQAQSEAPSVDELDKILYEYAMWRDNYYQDLEAGVLTEKEWIDIRDKVQSEAKAKINRLIVQEQTKLLDRIDDLVIYNTRPLDGDDYSSGFAEGHNCATEDIKRESEVLRRVLSNNLSKGDV